MIHRAHGAFEDGEKRFNPSNYLENNEGHFLMPLIRFLLNLCTGNRVIGVDFGICHFLAQILAHCYRYCKS